MPFTWQEALAGAVCIGLSTGFGMISMGRVVGISGISSNLLTNPLSTDTPWRLSFMAGLAGASKYMLDNNAVLGAYDSSLSQLTTPHAFGAGFMVGFGALVGNGCTSGHSICGISRFSLRSVFYTMVFMAAGFYTVHTNPESKTVAQIAGAAWPAQDPSAAKLSMMKSILMYCGAGYAGSFVLGMMLKSVGNVGKTISSMLSSLVMGASFAFGLGFAGMTRPSKVIAFLSITKPETFDPSLMIVMGVGIGLTTLLYRVAWNVLKKPFAGDDYCHTTTSTIDIRLAAGGLIFGIGWGMAGVCPGPLLANLITGNEKTLTVFAGFCSGIIAFKSIGFIDGILNPKSSQKDKVKKK